MELDYIWEVLGKAAREAGAASLALLLLGSIEYSLFSGQTLLKLAPHIVAFVIILVVMLRLLEKYGECRGIGVVRASIAILPVSYPYVHSLIQEVLGQRGSNIVSAVTFLALLGALLYLIRDLHREELSVLELEGDDPVLKEFIEL